MRLGMRKTGPGIDHALAISLLAIFVSTGVTLGVLVLSGAIKFVPSQMIPISGMIASNSMVAVGLAYRSSIVSFMTSGKVCLNG